MSDWNTERAAHKAARRAPTPDQPPPARKKKKAVKPYKVMYRLLGKEFVWHRAATREAAQAWIDKQARSAFVPRLRPATEQALETARERSERAASRYWIVGPEDK